MARDNIMIGNNHFSFETIGGMMKSWYIGDKPVIQPVHINKNGKSRGGIPLCSPFGPTPEKFGLEKHGPIRHTEMSMISRELKNRHVIDFQGYLQPTDEFPWCLEHKIRYTLSKNFVRIYVNIRYHYGSGLAPVNPGLHPYFTKKKKTESVMQDDHGYIEFSDKAYQITPYPCIIETIAGTIVMETFGTNTIYIWSDSEEYACIEPVLQSHRLFDVVGGGYYLAPEESVSIGMELIVI